MYLQKTAQKVVSKNMSKMNQRMTKYTNYRIFQRTNYYRNGRKRSENIRNTNHSLARPQECCHQAGASAPLTTRSRQFKIPGNIYSLRIITINRMTQIVKKGVSLYYRLHPVITRRRTSGKSKSTHRRNTTTATPDPPRPTEGPSIRTQKTPLKNVVFTIGTNKMSHEIGNGVP